MSPFCQCEAACVSLCAFLYIKLNCFIFLLYTKLSLILHGLGTDPDRLHKSIYTIYQAVGHFAIHLACRFHTFLYTFFRQNLHQGICKLHPVIWISL